VAAGVPEAAGRAAARGAEPGEEVLTAGLCPTDQWQDGERRWQLVLPPHEQKGSPSYE
jgi:hypothetical protein